MKSFLEALAWQPRCCWPWWNSILPAGVARAASPTDCASVGMDFADADAEKKCQAGDAGDSQWRGSEQIMVVKSSGYFIYVRRLKSGYQS